MKSVPQEILDQAKNCPYNFACLKNLDHEQCQKTHLKAYKLNEIIPKDGVDIDCNPYLINFENLKVSYCACLVYSYIHK